MRQAFSNSKAFAALLLLLGIMRQEHSGDPLPRASIVRRQRDIYVRRPQRAYTFAVSCFNLAASQRSGARLGSRVLLSVYVIGKVNRGRAFLSNCNCLLGIGNILCPIPCPCLPVYSSPISKPNPASICELYPTIMQSMI